MSLKAVRISIVTASKNAFVTIEQNILSVISQSFSDYEHIIIDGGSTDGTLDIIRSYQNDYPISLVSESDRGISDALNKGLKLAVGDYILVLQADDRLYHSGSLKEAVSYLADETCDIYTSPVLMEQDSDGLELIKPLKALWCHRFKTPFRHQGTIVHRRIFERIGFFSESFSIAMDYDFFYRALKLKPHIVYSNNPLSVMGAEGVGSRLDTMCQRLDQEYQVQKKNETSLLWRILQGLFRMVYLPYKVGAFDFTPITEGLIARSKKN